MSPKNSFPSVPVNLIDELEKRFPDRLPFDSVSHTDFAELVGQQKVIRFLRREFTKQNNPKEI